MTDKWRPLSHRRIRSERVVRFRVTKREVPASVKRYSLMLFFIAAGALILWAPSRRFVETSKRLDLFQRSVNPGLLAPVEALPPAEPSTNERLIQPIGESDDIKKPRAVDFRILAPAAKKVFLGGTFNNFDARKNPLSRRTDGTWETTLTLSPGRYLYKFKVDGRWELDPTNPEKSSDGQSGSLLEIR